MPRNMLIGGIIHKEPKRVTLISGIPLDLYSHL
jgi:hypothetical protein